jgi:tetratricopeptide (TPR) repeat protein
MLILKKSEKRITQNKSRFNAKLLAAVVLPFFIASCSNNNVNNTGTSVYKINDNNTPLEAVETGASDNSFLSLANEMVEQGDYSAAIPLFRRAHKWHPMNAAPLVGLGNSLSAIGQYNEATEAYQKALTHNSQNIDALKGLGSSYLALNRPTRSVPFLQAAIRINSRDVDAISSLALALDMQGHREASLEAYKDGLRVDPDNLKLLNNYGLSLALQSKHDESISILKQAAQHKDAGATHRQNLAMAYALAGNEIMSARLLSIDSGPDLTDSNLNYFKILTALPADERFDAVLNQSENDKTDITDVANEVYKDDDNQLVKAITVARLVEEMPEPVASIVKPEPEPQPETVDTGVPALLGPEGWALQIAAYRSKEELRPGWDKLKAKYFDIIGTLEPRRSEIDFGDRAGQNPTGYYYRLNAGPLTSYEEARIACQKIQELGTDCWVRPPEVTEGDIPASPKDKALADQFKYRSEIKQPDGEAKVEQNIE